MRQVDGELRADPEYGPFMLAPIEVFGVDGFAGSAVVIKVRLRTQPLRQWTIGREYNWRIKKAFDAAGIEIPFPPRDSVYGRGESPD